MNWSEGLVRVSDSEFPIRKSSRAKRIKFHVRGSSLEMVVPERCSKRRANQALRQSQRWILRALDECGRRAALAPVPSLWGEEVSLASLQEAAGHASSDHWELLRRLAKYELSEICREEAERMGLEPTRITVRDQKSRWGSCSSRGAISLNWRLIVPDPSIAHYICIHELAHLRHLNHSRGFWNEVERWCPDYKAHEAWLKKEGWLLMEAGR
jgi:predicted metal-dependent hydrolase